MQPARYHPPVKRSVQIAGHKTSISLEPLFWDMLKEAAATDGLPINAVVARIDAERIKSETPPGLASAVRIWLVARRFGANSIMNGDNTKI
ncbi:ribbon-helix-helix domain-containing protein [Pontixanthobacter aestiaquae]|nr:ribbon-helix-helix domain-containing protein [Pontixanthobacter aestiaquae]MDN3646747.1 ribbon-helix-helix domain-containing protein [Pontixanthobacter aestiaquae]